MVKISLFFILFFLATPAFALDNPRGLGIILGGPSAIVGQVHSNDGNDWQGALSWNTGNFALHVHADRIWNHSSEVKTQYGNLNGYFGVGAVLQLGGSVKIGARAPFGVKFKVNSAPVLVFLEIAPVFYVSPGIAFDTQQGLGVYYLF